MNMAKSLSPSLPSLQHYKTLLFHPSGGEIKEVGMDREIYSITNINELGG